MAKRITAEQITRMRELRTAGLSVRQVAARVGVSEATVKRRAGGFGNGHRLKPEVIARIRALRADGHTYLEVAAIVGCCQEAVRTYAPGHIGKVPVAPLREAFLVSSMTAPDVAREIGWLIEKGGRMYGDGARVKRTLGLLPDISGSNNRRSFRTLVDAETVGLIAEAIGIAAWSVMPDDDRPAWATESEAA